MDNGSIAIYKSGDGNLKINVHLDDEIVWLNQIRLAGLFVATKQVISYHLQNIFHGQELNKVSTVKDFLTVQKEDNRDVSRNIKYYNKIEQLARGDKS